MEGYSLLVSSSRSSTSLGGHHMLYNAGVKRKREQDAKAEATAHKTVERTDNARKEPEASESKEISTVESKSETLPEKPSTENNTGKDETENGSRAVTFTTKDGSKRTVHFKQKQQSSEAEHGGSGDKPSNSTQSETSTVQHDGGEGGTGGGSHDTPSTETAPSSDGNGPTNAPVAQQPDS